MRHWVHIMLSCAWLGAATPVSAQIASLALPGGTGSPGGSVALNLTFRANGAQVTGIQWTLNYSPADFSSVSVVATSLATGAGEVLSCHSLPDHTNCLMINPASRSVVIPDGTIAVATFNIAPGTTSTSSQITLTGLTATSDTGDALPLTGTGTPVAIDQAGPRPLVNVNAASFLPGPVAAESIVSAFAWPPFPAMPTGATVKVQDAGGTERLAPLFYLSPSQVNYEVPPGTALGPATVTIATGDSSISAPIEIVTVAPGIFMLNDDGLVAANVFRVQPGNVQSYEPVFQIDPTTQQLIALPVNLGPETDQVYLVIYGTGIRGRSSLSVVSVTIGGGTAQVTYAGPQGPFIGLDQVNVLLPRSLQGRGAVDIVMTVDGKAANTVRVTIH